MINKKILFIDGQHEGVDELRFQILEEIKSALPSNNLWADCARDHTETDALTVSLFPDVPADILLMFDLSDRNHFLRSDDKDRPVVPSFNTILVPGPWLRNSLLSNSRLNLKPESVIDVGSPRIDLLCRLQAQQQTREMPDDKRPRVLFVSMPDNWHDQSGKSMSLRGEIADTLNLLRSSFDITVKRDSPNRPKKTPITDELLAADVIITDYASVMYEAWALGKPVIFPRWLTGDRVLDKAPKSAEAHVYRERIGHHPDSIIALFDLLDAYQEIGLGDGVDAFMADYRSHHHTSGNTIAAVLQNKANTGRVLELHRTAKSLRVSIAEKDWQTAIGHITKQIELDPQNATHFDQLARMHHKQDETALECAALEAAVHFSPQQAEWFMRLGVAAHKLNQNGKAAKAWAQAIALKPSLGTSGMYYKLGLALETPSLDNSANNAAAKAAYAQACKKSKTTLVTKYGVGMLHSGAGNWKEAQAALRDRLRTMPLDAELHYHIGMTHDRCYEWADAEDCYTRALTLNTNEMGWHFRLGFVRERQGKFDKAADAYLFAATTNKKHRPTWFYRAGYTLEKAGRLQEACDAFAAVVPQEQNKADNNAAYLSDFNHKNLHRELLEHDPENASLLFAYSQKLEATGDITGAYKTAEKAVQRAKTANKVYKAWQVELAERMRKAADCKMLLDYNCTNAADWNAYSIVLAANGENDAAVKALRHAILRSNRHQTAWYNRLGVLLTHLGQLEEACDVFRSQHILQRPHGTWETKFTQSAALRETTTYREFYDTLPLMEKSVLYESFGGEGCSDNPLAMFNQIQNDPRFEGWLHIWSIRGKEKIPPALRNRTDVVFVEKDSVLYQRYLATVPYLINNATFPFYYTRRDGQHYLNTWHGTPLKTLGYDINATPLQRANTARNLIQSSMFIAPNTHTENVMIDRYGVRNLFTGTSLISGYPRIDMLINATEADKTNIYKTLGLDPTKPVVLFAPTYRGHWATPELEAQSLVESLERLKNPKYNLVFRGHYFAEKFIDEMDLDVIIAPHAIDTCSLLSIVDVLITDYSSIFYDFLITKRPVIHFVHDWDYYVETRGMYFEKDQLPGIVCEDEDSLIAALDQCITDPEAQITPQYLADLERYCSREDGKASERVVQALFFDLSPEPVHAPRPKGVKHFAFYAGVCDTGPELRNLRGLTAATKSAGHINTALIDRYQIINSEERTANTQNLLTQTDVIMRFGRATMSLEESWIESKIKTVGYKVPPALLEAFAPATAFETRRIVGHTRFDIIVDLNTRSQFWSRILAECNADLRIANLGGDFFATRATLAPKLQNDEMLLQNFDVLLNHTDTICEKNKNALKLENQVFKVLPPFNDPDMRRNADHASKTHNNIVCFTHDFEGFLNMPIANEIETTLTLCVPQASLADIWKLPLASPYYQKIQVIPDTRDNLQILQKASLVVFPQGDENYACAFTEAANLGVPCLFLGTTNKTTNNLTSAQDLLSFKNSLVQQSLRQHKNTTTQHNINVFKQFMSAIRK